MFGTMTVGAFRHDENAVEANITLVPGPTEGGSFRLHGIKPTVPKFAGHNSYFAPPPPPSPFSQNDFDNLINRLYEWYEPNQGRCS